MNDATFTNETYGIEVRVKPTPNGRFAIVLHDVEAGEYLPSTVTYATEAAAVAYAKKCVK